MGIAEIACGIILMTVLGLAVGNYATSITFRLPRGLKIANDPPYCDSCRTYLETRDMFPFVSWVINRAKCRFCGARVPALYAFVELACAALFNAAFFVYWPQAVDAFLAVLGLGVFTITLLSLHIAEKRLYTLIVVLVVGFGAIFRVLFDKSVFGFLYTGYFGLMAGAVGWGIRMMVARRKLRFPDFAIMAAVAALCVSKTQLPLLGGIAAVGMVIFWLIGRRSESIRGSEGVIAISVALFAVLLLSHRGVDPYNQCHEPVCDKDGCTMQIIADCGGFAIGSPKIPSAITTPLVTCTDKGCTGP